MNYELPQPYAIEAQSGAMFDFNAPSSSDVDINDVALALGNTCRFGGHVKKFYSVAEHACVVSDLVRSGFDAELAYAALHHDSHEAYLGDVPTPLKRKIKALAPGVWEDFEDGIDASVAEAFGIEQALFGHDSVRAADSSALAY